VAVDETPKLQPAPGSGSANNTTATTKRRSLRRKGHESFRTTQNIGLEDSSVTASADMGSLDDHLARVADQVVRTVERDIEQVIP
jgi:hypothetical protein